MPPTEPIAEPTLLQVHPSGALEGADRSYVKRLGEMTGVYHDDDAYREQLARYGADRKVYSVHDQRTREVDGELIVGTSTVQPGRYGDEFAMTRGHLHQRAECAEMYYCLSGAGVMLMETVDGRSEAIEMRPGQAVNVPGYWIHRSINIGDEPFVTLFCYPVDAGQDYDLISKASGMRQLVVAVGDDGWTTIDNPAHRGYIGRDES